MLRVEQKRHYPRDRQDVARYLVSRGCRTDLLMAAALGDVNLVRHHLDTDPACIRMSVSEAWFPKKDPRAGGTIYIWMLGANRTAHVVARDFGHEQVFELLMERTPEDLKLALACELGDESTFQDYLARNPDATKTLSDAERRKLPAAAQSNNTKAVQLMLEAGWPVNTPGEMGATALHWAGFNGNAEMTRDILRFHPDIESKSREYAGTALSWALYASGNGWHRSTEISWERCARFLMPEPLYRRTPKHSNPATPFWKCCHEFSQAPDRGFVPLLPLHFGGDHRICRQLSQTDSAATREHMDRTY
jgi:hypothetical protein